MSRPFLYRPVEYSFRTHQYKKDRVKTTSCPNPPGRPKDPAKRAALLEAAGRLFCEHGFEHTRLEAIARAAGVSKLTIYSHFGDKEGLFTAAVEARCQDQLPRNLFIASTALPLDLALRRIGLAFLDLVYSDQALRLTRMMAAQGGGSSRLAALYYAAGPKRVLEEMEGFLARAAARGVLALDDPALAAARFFVLLKGITHFRCLIGLEPPPSARARSRHVVDCVEWFLRAHGRNPDPP